MLFEAKIFLHQGRYTWTETWYWMGAGFQQALSAISQLAAQRLPFTPNDVTIGRVRVVSIPAGAGVLQDGVEQAANLANAMNPNVALLVRLLASDPLGGNSYSTPLYLRGLPAGFWLGSAQARRASNLIIERSSRDTLRRPRPWDSCSRSSPSSCPCIRLLHWRGTPRTSVTIRPCPSIRPRSPWMIPCW